jgi:hypothetical protein
MKKMKTYGKAPLSFGNLPQGERKDVCLQSRQGSRKHEARSITGTPVSDFPSESRAGLFLIIYFLFPEKENNENPITLPGLLTGNVESGRKISGHVILIPEGLHVYREMDNLENSTPNGVVHFNSSWYFYKHLMPLASGKPGTTATMITTTTTTSKYKANPLLPRGRFYSGDCPGAAAITIIISLFSSPRVSPNWVAGFSTPHSILCGVENSASRSACKGLPVANQQAYHQGSIVPLVKGDKSRFIGTGGPGDKTSENQEVSTTSPKIRMKGFKPERRYAYVLN